MTPPRPYALVGGGTGAGIGELHRAAAPAAGFTLVAGSFSREPGRNRAVAAALGLAPDRCHDTVAALVGSEAARADGARLLVVCTPHVFHHEAAVAALAAGWAVVVEKPVCTTPAEASSLRAAAGDAQPMLAVPLVMRFMPGLQRMKAAFEEGRIGALKWVAIEYLQDRGARAGDWRFRRALAGPAGTLADLGPHAFDLCHWLTGAEPSLRAADVRTLDPAHELDDCAWLWLDLPPSARAAVMLCQAAAGVQATCRVRLFGSAGTLGWSLDEEAAAAGGVEALYREAFMRFWRGVSDWLAGAPAGTLPRWPDALRGVRLMHDSLVLATGYKQ